MNFTNEILAKLMSSEDIGVTYGNVTTAYFNTETRTLVLPNWDGLKEIELQLLIAHEIGHALYTPSKDWVHYVKTNPSNFKNYLNVVEDARIEKMVKNKFPGTKKVFYYGYSALGERKNIFPEDTKEYHFLDFLNVYFKFGVLRELDLNEDHKYFINKMEQMETFNDVYAVAKELYYFCADKPFTSKGSYTLSKTSDGNEEGSSDGSSDQHSESESNSKSKKKSKNNSGKNDGQNSSDGDGKEEKQGKQQGAARSGSHGSRTSNTDQQLNKEPVTIDSLEDVLKTLVSSKKNIVASVPDPILENIIRPYKTVLQDFELAELRAKSKTPIYTTPIDEVADKFDGLELLDDQELKEMTSMNALKTFLNNNSPSINYHKQLFEMRKKAIEHNRTMTYRSGLLDMNKIYSYKYEDQIFKTFQVKQTGKKHGLIFFLDMSSSMMSYFRSAIKKMLEIVLFCRESGIPFNVYGFTTHTFNSLPRFTNYGNMEYRLGFTEGFSLIELLSYKMNNSEFRKAFDIIFKKVGINATVEGYGLYGTPLNETVLCLDPIVKKFKNDTNSQIVNVVFFTDGYGSGYGFNLNRINKAMDKNPLYHSWYQESNYVIYDTKSKNNFVLDDFKYVTGAAQRQTAVLLAVMKKRMPYVNIMNYYITHDLFDLTTQEFLNEISQRTSINKTKINYNYNDRLTINRYLDQEQICIIDNCNGFDQAYILTPGFLRKDGPQKRGKNKTTVKSSKEEFKGQSANKKKQNKLISDFINMIV